VDEDVFLVDALPWKLAALARELIAQPGQLLLSGQKFCARLQPFPVRDDPVLFLFLYRHDCLPFFLRSSLTWCFSSKLFHSFLISAPSRPPQPGLLSRPRRRSPTPPLKGMLDTWLLLPFRRALDSLRQMSPALHHAFADFVRNKTERGVPEIDERALI